MSDQYKYVLDEKDMPEAWYNINPDMPVNPAETAWNAVLHPGTQEPATPEFLSVLFPMRFIGEAVSMDSWIEIPEPVREIYKLWRPSPLIRARRLEKALDTPAHIYYKSEGFVIVVEFNTSPIAFSLWLTRYTKHSLHM